MNLKDHITRRANTYEVPSQLAHAIAQVETGYDTYHSSYDPTWEWFYETTLCCRFRRVSDDEVLSAFAPADFSGAHVPPDAEWIGQKSTWGPFAMRGYHLRAVGYTDRFQALFFNEDFCVHFFLVYLLQLHKRYGRKHGWSGVAAAYHSGRPRMTDGNYTNVEYIASLCKAVPSLRDITPYTQPRSSAQ